MSACFVLAAKRSPADIKAVTDTAAIRAGIRSALLKVTTDITDISQAARINRMGCSIPATADMQARSSIVTRHSLLAVTGASGRAVPANGTRCRGLEAMVMGTNPRHCAGSGRPAVMAAAAGRFALARIVRACGTRTQKTVRSRSGKIDFSSLAPILSKH